MYIHSRICLPRWLPKLKLTWRALYWISVTELYCKWSFIQLCCLSYVWFVLFYHIEMTSYKMNSSNGWLFVIRRGTNTIRSFADFSNIMYHRYDSLGYYIFERKRCKKNRFICLTFNIRNKTLGGIFYHSMDVLKLPIYVFSDISTLYFWKLAFQTFIGVECWTFLNIYTFYPEQSNSTA